MACPSDDTLLSWRSGKLPGDAVRAVEQHVDQCADCQAVLHAAAASFDASRTDVGATLLPAALAPGELVAGRYRIVQFVGSGGMGTVYAALDEELGQPVALKTLHERFVNDPQAIMRLKREALLARRITHANVCRIFDVGYDRREGHGTTHPPQIFLTMELLRGETLRQRLRRGRLTMSEARPLVEQLAAALSAAHAGRVIHRDLKSDNVILVATETGTRVVVTDFGLARAILGDDTRLSRSGALIGTPAYMAPEQILAGPVDTAVDIYALGVVMFEMLTGELPFESSPSPSPIKDRLMGRPRSPRALVPELSASWERVVTRCLEPEPSDRFARVDEVVVALDAAPPQRRPRVGLLAITAGALVALGLAALGGVAWRAYDSAPSARANRLFCVTPSIASSGATVTLDGLFGSAADARFAGAAPVRITAIGPDHAIVQVPASARSGELAVARGTSVIGTAPFHRTSFPLGIGVFERYYEQVEGGRWTPALTAPREYQSSVVIGDSLYVIGGYHKEFLASVERSTIHADGSLSLFSVVPNTALQTARDGHASIIIGTSLYVIGGNSQSDALDTIERATINADGSLSAFSTLPHLRLNRARAFHTCEIVGDSLYVIGGIGVSEDRLASVERATIGADGSLGPFSTLPVRLSTPRSNFTSIVSGRSLYVIGGARTEGDDDIEALDRVERAAILPDGSLSRFTIVSQLGVARGYHTSALLGDELYVIGGRRAREWLSSVERATLRADGSLGPFAILPRASLGIGRGSHSGAIIGNSIYVIGGSVNDGRGYPLHRADIESGTVNARGELAPFSAVPGTALAVARSSHTTVVAHDSLYLIGGFADRGLSSVEHARLLSDGSLSPWEIAPDVALSKPRRAASSVVIGEWLYIIGGTVDDGRADATIERARFDRGSLSSFSLAHNVALVTPRSEHTSVVIGEWIYIIGGVDQQGHALSLSERAHIGAGTRLSSFTPAAELALTTARRGHSLAVVGDWVYVIGGADAADRALGTIERARIRADGTLDRFAPVPGIALTTARHGHSNAVVGGWLYVIGGDNGAPLGSIERAAIGAGGELGPFSSASITLRVARRAHGNVVLGNFLYVLGGRSDHPLSTIERADLL